MLILKFSPYFPPHKGGLESHIQERSERRYKKGYGKVINITTSIGQEENIKINNTIKYKGSIIGYHTNNYEVITLNSFDLIPGFPFPKFWTKNFRNTINYLKQKIKNKKKECIINTHTRFFLTSLIGGLFAKLNGLKRIHIEHGVDYVKLSSKRKSFIAWIFDETIGRYIFRCSDAVIGISGGCKKFANKFTKKEIFVIHRGINFEIKEISNKKKSHNINLGFVGRLVKLKGVDLLIDVFNILQKTYKNITLQIVGDGDQYKELLGKTKALGLTDKISFLGFKDKEYIANIFLTNIDILINPSYQEGLPTSVLEGLLAKCVVVATNVGGTPEISKEKDLILVEKGNKKDLQRGLEEAINNYSRLKGLSYNHVKNHFNRNKNIENYYNFYKYILNNEK